MRLRGGPGGSADADDLRETVRARYAAAAPGHHRTPPRRPGAAAPDAAIITDEQAELFGARPLRRRRARRAARRRPCLASLGCGNPTAVAELHAGEIVLDLGSGGGIDVLLSARRVAPTGTAYGLDMTDEMLDLARANQAKAGVENVALAQGPHRGHPAPRRERRRRALQLRHQPLDRQAPGAARDRRVLKPGGRFAVSDVIADPGMDDATRADLAQYVGCIAGALTNDEYTPTSLTPA